MDGDGRRPASAPAGRRSASAGRTVAADLEVHGGELRSPAAARKVAGACGELQGPRLLRRSTRRRRRVARRQTDAHRAGSVFTGEPGRSSPRPSASAAQCDSRARPGGAERAERHGHQRHGPAPASRSAPVNEQPRR
jgi:hypothetical protein